MTIFELFPWLLAVCVTVLTGTLLKHAGLSGGWLWVSATAAGIGSFVAYRWTLKLLVSSLQQRRTRKEKHKRVNREYRRFDPAESHPVEKNLFYECLACGNTVHSMSKKGSSCKCQNVMIDADSGRIKIRDNAKVKLFSRPSP
jgi:hypothetical protein